ncbi:MAG: UDP-N-acetylmuramoyl-L-alanine--D-glutamate ligase [Desulfovibrio sp.]|uniref:UDP-N-acetylmuramoyl-L-alanine--D-glutamate ligase n=1 Tax=Desulfovibrio sp. 7SRBS1 TaxID=3378064 RepID=UPI003B3DF0CA
MQELIHQGQLTGYKGAVVGTGSSGLAATRLLCALGASVRLLDVKEPSDEVRSLCTELGVDLQVGPHSAKQFKDRDIVVLSPGVQLSKLRKYMKTVPDRKIVSELELASWFTVAPIIAVTGTNGKTTTTRLISRMLEFSGRKVFTGGNIGTPLSEYLLSGQKADALVLEVSSFQLSTCRSFKPQVGLLLNISENHLDYHADMEEYFEAKLSMFRRQTDRDLAIFPLELREAIEKRVDLKAKRVYFVPSQRFDAPHLPGAHNKANLEAAWLAARAFGVTEHVAQRAVKDFKPDPNRLEVVAEKNGLLFVNDSKATTIAAVAAALQAFDRPIRLLVGGKFKGGDLGALVPLFENRVLSVCGFGASREIFEQAWEGKIPMHWEKTMEPAVARLVSEASKGDVILLSPGTSSFDLYKNYEARGEDFRRLVEAM